MCGILGGVLGVMPIRIMCPRRLSASLLGEAQRPCALIIRNYAERMRSGITASRCAESFSRGACVTIDTGVRERGV